MKEEIREITVEEAQRLLRNMPEGQRNSRNEKVLKYAKYMDEDKWVPEVSNPIVINADGLRNGVHRLKAIIRHDKSVMMKVAYDVPDDHLRYMDLGVQRGAGDILLMSGITDARTAATVITSDFWYRNKVDDAVGLVQTEDDVLAIAQAVPDLVEKACRFGANMQKRVGVVKGPCGAALFLILQQIENRAAVLQFADSLVSGEMLSGTNPILTLRNYLAGFKLREQSGPKTVATKEAVMKAIIRGWNAYATGEALQAIYIRHEWKMPVQVTDTYPHKWVAS